MRFGISILFLVFFYLIPVKTQACSVVYFVDKSTGKIYFANNEDYWYNTKAYIKIIPGSGNKLARLWYGWDDFAQGGINQAGLFFDGAATPKQNIPSGYNKPKDNLGDEVLAHCKTVEDAIKFLESKNVALNNAHMMFGDSTGNAVVVEWVNGEKHLIRISDNQLVMTNFLLSKPDEGNHPCYRYNSIKERINKLETNNDIDFLKFANVIAGAAQAPQKNEEGKTGGTLYSSFCCITDMEFILVHKLNNSAITKLDLKAEFKKGKAQKIKLR